MTPTAQILVGDVRERLAELPDESVHLSVCSPPYYALRSYLPADHPDKAKELGSEIALDCLSWATGAEPCRACWICSMRDTFAAVRRVLRRDGVMWVNCGDSYFGSPRGSRGEVWGDDAFGRRSDNNSQGGGGIDAKRVVWEKCGGQQAWLKPKDMCLAPSRLALALQADGWYVRSIAPYVKRNAMPQSVTDRPSTSLEWMIMLTREARYFWDMEAVRRGTIPDSRDGRWGSTKQTSRHGHEADAEQGMMQTRTQADGYVRMSNPAGRNLRDSDWWFDSVGMLLRDEVLGFDVVSEPSSDAHYASYPRRLVRDVVLAGSSGAGVCCECGAPWVRVAVDAPEYASLKFASEWTGGGSNGSVSNTQGPAGNKGATPRVSKSTQTLGFRPSCSHTSAPRVSATILDPFCGRGTTGVVALEYGRSFIGIELSEEYAAMARRRLAAVECQPLLDVTAPEPAPRAEQMTMEVVD